MKALHCLREKETAVLHFNILHSQFTIFKKMNDICFEGIITNVEQPAISET